MLRVVLAALHLLALAIGLQAVLQRAQWPWRVVMA